MEPNNRLVPSGGALLRDENFSSNSDESRRIEGGQLRESSQQSSRLIEAAGPGSHFFQQSQSQQQQQQSYQQLSDGSGSCVQRQTSCFSSQSFHSNQSSNWSGAQQFSASGTSAVLPLGQHQEQQQRLVQRASREQDVHTQQFQQHTQTTSKQNTSEELVGACGGRRLITGLDEVPSPPIFRQIFRNARFAQGGTAQFEGQVTGSPTPEVQWNRQGSPIANSGKYQLTYDRASGRVCLSLTRIGPGDEGEYTCTATNCHGEAVCTVYIQPEGAVQSGLQCGDQAAYTQKNTGNTQNFVVEHFESRLMRERSYRESILGSYTTTQLTTPPCGDPTNHSPANITTKPRPVRTPEGGDAVFEAVLSGVPTPRATWFFNGTLLNTDTDSRYIINQENGLATLRIHSVSAVDNGYYTLYVDNPVGIDVASACLAVESSSHAQATQQALMKSAAIRSQFTEESSQLSTISMRKPRFIKVPDGKQLQTGSMARFECQVEGQPPPEVSWQLNGHPIVSDSVHKVVVNGSGGHTLLITNISPGHTGTLTAVACNQAGRDECQVQIMVTDKPEITAPKFVERLQAVSIRQGESTTLCCQATGCPTPRITWQKDGNNLKNSPNFQITADGGISKLRISNVLPTCTGWYQCTAQNTAGSTVTRARLTVITDDLPSSGQQLTSEMDQSSFSEVVHLKHVEKSVHEHSQTIEETVYPPPEFASHLKDLKTAEGSKILLEAKLLPIDDSSLSIEWYLNGSPLPASARITATHRFGYVSLSVLSSVIQDSGVFTCVATSKSGSAQSSCKVTIEPRHSIEAYSAHSQTLQTTQSTQETLTTTAISTMEQNELEIQQAPVFLSQLKNAQNLVEGSNIRLDCRIQPESDPTLKLEWYKNGQPLTASSRIAAAHSFGQAVLNISKVRVDDSGTYTLRAINRMGEAINQAEVSVCARDSSVESQAFSTQRHSESLEFHKHSAHHYQHSEHMDSSVEQYSSPMFVQPLCDVTVQEGCTALLEARLQPSSDPSLTVEWLKDGRPLEASSRSGTLLNFGYVSLTIRQLSGHDSGLYTCVARSSTGMTKTEAYVQCQIPADGRTSIEKLETLEPASKKQRFQSGESVTQKPPRFLSAIKGTNIIKEGQKAHFEARLEPQNDSSMQVTWLLNGQSIQHANRIHTYWNFGYAALDISSVKMEDAGVYMLVAKNELGEISEQAEMKVEAHSMVDSSSIHRSIFQTSSKMEQSQTSTVCDGSSTYFSSKPQFTETLQDQVLRGEGRSLHLQCRVEPAGDPSLQLEWLLNGHALTVGSRRRCHTHYDLTTLDIADASSDDIGVYTVRARNRLGEVECSAQVRLLQKPIGGTAGDKEAFEPYMDVDNQRVQLQREESEAVQPQAPTFTKPLKNIDTVEGTNVHLECRLQPIGDNTMTVEWFINNQPLKAGHRYRPAHDFDYVALDLLSVYPRDSGMFTCRATNSTGQAVTSASVRVQGKDDCQYATSIDQYSSSQDSSRLQIRHWEEEEVQIKPHFLSQLKPQEGLLEGHNAHFEAKLEPVNDPNLQVEWLKDGSPIIVGHRHRPLHDFGYVALDIVGLIEADNGVYTCRATNRIGSDMTSAPLVCSGDHGVSNASKLQLGTDRFQMLEDRSKVSTSREIEETTAQAPVFTTSLTNVCIKEGQRAHFEARLIPVSDPSMQVYWFVNGQPVKTGSRFVETNSFGFVALDLLYAYVEDQGTYSCRATNALGEAVTQATLSCYSPDAVDHKAAHEQTMAKLRCLEQKGGQRQRLDELTSQSPVFTSPIKDICIMEGRPLHFESRLIPVGDPKLRVEWFKNGVPLQMANRISTLHDFGFVALDIKQTQEDDSGTYSCRASNELGQAVTSATAIVQSKETILTTYHESSLEKLRLLEEHSRKTTVIEDIIITEKPSFTLELTGKQSLIEGESAHMEARVRPYPDPDMKIGWYFNKKPLSIGHRYRTISEFGFVALDVLSVAAEDSGEYTVVATNRHGSTTSSLTLNIQSRAALIQSTQHPAAMQKISYLESEHKRHWTTEGYAASHVQQPMFGRALRNVSLSEGQSCHLEATLTPVNDPSMRVEWFRDGHPISQGHRFRTTCDFGFVALDILYTYPEDTGTYMCKATNNAGEAVTTCSAVVSGKQSLYTDTLDAVRLEKIKSLENAEKPQTMESKPEMRKPVFTPALVNLENLYEGEHVHMECRLEPVNDPNLRVEWYVNSKEVKAGHRFRTTHDFGYVALDILYGYAEDSGTYMCKAINEKGEAVSTCSVRINERKSVYLDTHHPEGLQKIKDLESRETPQQSDPSIKPQQPRFTHELKGVTQLREGERAHLEARVEPMHDSTLHIQWFHNDNVLPSSSRCHTTFDFGYVALDLHQLVAEDSGRYTCRAVNTSGEVTSQIELEISANDGVIDSTQRPEAVETIKKLESRVSVHHTESAVSYQKPIFTQSLQSVDSLDEGQTLTLTARLIPVGDPKLAVEWFRNDQPLQSGTRYTSTHEFGCVSLEISSLRRDDEGVYMCRAKNQLGEAVTTASLQIKTQASIIRESQHSVPMEKLEALEQKTVTSDVTMEEIFERPVFTMSLTGQSELIEGQKAQLRARCLPVGDPTLRFEWFCNGSELKIGSRLRETHDFGFVTLDIGSVVQEDSGIYMCRAINSMGEAITSFSMKVKDRHSVLGGAISTTSWSKIQQTELYSSMQMETSTALDDLSSRTDLHAPVFTTHLQSHDQLLEQQSVHLEANLEPRTDTHLRVEWSKNGVPLMTGARLRSAFDFGLVTLDIMGLRGDDSGIYTCRAVNQMGEAVSTCTIKVEDKHWLMGQSQRPQALPVIAGLEVNKGHAVTEGTEQKFATPAIRTHLNNVSCVERATAHFECRVEPAKDPNLKIEWLLNQRPMKIGTRITTGSEFGLVTLDIAEVLSDDAGVIVCKVSNKHGYAKTTGTLNVKSKSGVVYDTFHPTGEQGLQKIEQVDSASQKKTPRTSGQLEKKFTKPWFPVTLNATTEMSENSAFRLTCQVEPKEDPCLKVDWFFNGKPILHGSRLQTSNEFGMATLILESVHPRDQGIYTCRAANTTGEAFTSTTATFSVGMASRMAWQDKAYSDLSEEELQELEAAKLRGEGPPLPDELGHAPKFTSKFENVTGLTEHDSAHFEATLTPIGDQTMKVEWFYKGKPLTASHRMRRIYAFGMVVLDICDTNPGDSGQYTCRATNKWGQTEISVKLDCKCEIGGAKPQFTTQIQSVSEVIEGESVHFECQLLPIDDANLRVEWLHNGKALSQSSRIKTVHDFGCVTLDIADVRRSDAGDYVCRAVNKFGRDETRAQLSASVGIRQHGVLSSSLQPQSLQSIAQLEQQRTQSTAGALSPDAQPPRFTKTLTSVMNLVEGQSAHLEAHITPVNDPALSVEWFRNGAKLPSGHRFRTFHDFGVVILDILYCYEEDSGEYECRAVNKAGTDTTKAQLKCLPKTSLILTPQIPEEMSRGLEKIQNLEDSSKLKRTVDVESRAAVAPRFISPFSNISNLKEGENAHFEAKLIPSDDDKLKVEWYFNSKPLSASSRIRTLSDFGFVILEISPVYPEDGGEYTCRAFNEAGEATTSASLHCSGKRSIVLESQLPKGMECTLEKIAALEGVHSRREAFKAVEEGAPPQFLSQPADVSLVENQLAHFECRLTPIGDPTMRIEWFHNGKPLTSGSRIRTVNDFGYVILEIGGIYQRDSGRYTCKAVNRHGEATTSCLLTVKGRQGIIMEPQLPQGIDGIRRLEESLYRSDQTMIEDEQGQPPRFIDEIQPQLALVEGQPAHFECRVEPVGDPSMHIEWLHNGTTLNTGSRVHVLNDFGFIVLDLDWTYPRDTGEYMCRATNKWGSATTKTNLSCQDKQGVIMDSQLPRGMTGDRLRELEESLKKSLPCPMEMHTEHPPSFVRETENVDIGEGEVAFFECQIEPKNDPYLTVQWFCNGQQVKTGHRFRTTFDFGYASLQILSVYPEDGGQYSCRAINRVGEAVSTSTLTCSGISSVIMLSQVPKGMQKSDYLMQMEAALKKYTSNIFLTENDIYDPDKQQPPRFVVQIENKMDLVDMQDTKFECQLAPVGDPYMKVEWFFKGRPLPYKNRFTPIYDFGYVAMNFGWVYPEDSGEYMCRATNLYGSDETKAIIQTKGKPGIIYESQLPAGMESVKKIQEMEALRNRAPDSKQEEERPQMTPQFVTKPEGVTVTEGDWARFYCRVTGYPRPRVMWLINGRTIVNGSRFKLTYDGMWRLDIPKTRHQDNGKIEVIARNSAGEAYCCCEVKIEGKQDDYRTMLKSSPKLSQESDLDQVYRQKYSIGTSTYTEDLQTMSETGGLQEISRRKPSTLQRSDTEWQMLARSRRDTEYLSTYKRLEGEQYLKERMARQRKSQQLKPAYDLSLVKTSELVQHFTSNICSEDASSTVSQTDDVDSVPEQKPRFVRVLKPRSVKEGQPVEFVAEARGLPVPEIYWYLNEELVTSDMNLQTITTRTSSRLRIQMTKRSEIPVNVQCVAENEHGRCSCSALLSVTKEAARSRDGRTRDDSQRSPVILRPLKDSVVKHGSVLRLDVELDCVEPMEVLWKKNKTRIHADRRHKFLVEENVHTLLVLEPTLLDSGIYEFFASNKHGLAQSKARVKVHRGLEEQWMEPLESPQPGVAQPEVIEPLRAIYTEEGKSAVFKCQFSGEPAPSMKWYKGDTPIKPSRFFRTSQPCQGVCTLTIAECYPEDAVVYRCVAENIHGHVSTSAALIVTEYKTCELIAPRIVQRISRQTAQEASWLEMKAVAKPEPRVTCLINNIPVVSENDVIQFYDSHTGGLSVRLPLVSEQPENIYIVKVENRLGSVRSIAKIALDEKPVEEITFDTPPSIVVPIQSAQLVHGQHATFTTVVEGTPLPDIQWALNGHSAELIPGTHVESEVVEDLRSTLHLPSTVIHDDDVVEVLVSNMVGLVRSSASMTLVSVSDKASVHSLPPCFVNPMKSQIVYPGEPVFLDAEVVSEPIASITWHTDDKQISTSHKTGVVNIGNISHLVIDQATASDSGEYQCLAENVFGLVKTTAFVQVHQPVELKTARTFHPIIKSGTVRREAVKTEESFGGSPMVKALTPLVKVLDGSEIELKCKINIANYQSVVWQHEGRSLDDHRDVEVMMSPDRVCALYISEAFPEDAGKYTCTVKNPFDTATVNFLVVVDKLEYEQDSEISPGSIGSANTSDEVWETEFPEVVEPVLPVFSRQLPITNIAIIGEPLTLECVLDGASECDIQWKINNIPVTDSNSYIISSLNDGTQRLVITHMSPQCVGSVVCQAENVYGIATTVSQVVETPIGHTEGSPGYRKPDWVIKMEETKAAIRAKQKPPVFSEECSDMTARENDEEVQFRCVVHGIPRPEIQCFHNETRLSLSRFVRIVYVDNRVILTLCSLTPDMAGEYSVRALNAVGEAVTRANLTIIELTEEERDEIRKKKEEALRKRKQREQERIARLEEKRRLQEEAARKLREKKEFLRPSKVKKAEQPGTPALAEKSVTVTDSKTKTLEKVKIEKAEKLTTEKLEWQDYKLKHIDISSDTTDTRRHSAFYDKSDADLTSEVNSSHRGFEVETVEAALDSATGDEFSSIPDEGETWSRRKRRHQRRQRKPRKKDSRRDQISEVISDVVQEHIPFDNKTTEKKLFIDDSSTSLIDTEKRIMEMKETSGDRTEMLDVSLGKYEEEIKETSLPDSDVPFVDTQQERTWERQKKTKHKKKQLRENTEARDYSSDLKQIFEEEVREVTISSSDGQVENKKNEKQWVRRKNKRNKVKSVSTSLKVDSEKKNTKTLIPTDESGVKSTTFETEEVEADIETEDIVDQKTAQKEKMWIRKRQPAKFPKSTKSEPKETSESVERATQYKVEEKEVSLDDIEQTVDKTKSEKVWVRPSRTDRKKPEPEKIRDTEIIRGHEAPLNLIEATDHTIETLLENICDEFEVDFSVAVKFAEISLQNPMLRASITPIVIHSGEIRKPKEISKLVEAEIGEQRMQLEEFTPFDWKSNSQMTCQSIQDDVFHRAPTPKKYIPLQWPIYTALFAKFEELDIFSRQIKVHSANENWTEDLLQAKVSSVTFKVSEQVDFSKAKISRKDSSSTVESEASEVEMAEINQIKESTKVQAVSGDEISVHEELNKSTKKALQSQAETEAIDAEEMKLSGLESRQVDVVDVEKQATGDQVANEISQPVQMQITEQLTTEYKTKPRKLREGLESAEDIEMNEIDNKVVEARRRITELEGYMVEEISVRMSVEEIEQFIVERAHAQERLSTLEAPLIQEISAEMISQELKKITAEKVVAETKLSILSSYSVTELTPQTTTVEMKTFVNEREVAEETWHSVEKLPVAEPLKDHIENEIWQVRLDRSVAEFKLNMTDAFQVQELRPDLSTDELELFIEERREARRRVSTSCALDVVEVTSEEVVRDLARLLSVEEVSAQMKLDLMRSYAVQQVTTESSLDEMKTFITEMHHVEQMLSTALISAENAEVCPMYVASEIDHVKTQKSLALDHLEMINPQAVQEMETLLQATFPLRKFKDFDYDYYFGAITVYYNIYLPPDDCDDPEYRIERVDPVKSPQ